MSAAGRGTALSGVAYALGAFGIWGLVPIYFKAVAHVPPPQVLAHRVVWAALLLAAVLLARRRGAEIPRELRRPGRLRQYLTSALFVSLNWLVFIWAIQNDRVLQASLGYYINPLVSVVLGMVFLGERLAPAQKLAVALALAGVFNLVIAHGTLPWVSLTLALSFGTYGLLRKRAGGDAVLGLCVEMLAITPLALLYLGLLAARGGGAFGVQDPVTDGLLVLSGVVTAVPLVLFLEATRRLRLASVGLVQYVTPTGHFLLAVLAFGEPFTPVHLITFVCIWSALAVYSADAWRSHRAARALRSAR